MMIEFSGPDLCESCAVRLMIMLLCMTKKKVKPPSIAAILCVSKMIRRKLKVGIEQKLRERERLEDEKERRGGG